MRKTTIDVLAFAAVLAIGLGCGLFEKAKQETFGEPANTAESNKTITDRAVDTAVGNGTIGIPECDAVLDFLVEQANNPEDNFIVKAAKRTALNSFRDELKRRIDNNNTDKKEIAKYCKDFKDNLSARFGEANANKK